MGQKYTSISDLYKQVKLNEQEIIERKLTSQELEDREKIAKKLPMDDFKKRYGKDAMAVKMATATNIDSKVEVVIYRYKFLIRVVQNHLS